MEKYGIVYIWRDRKHKRYYIGSHWGTEDDGYVCSSTWMLAGYARRPKDFKRRIVARLDDRAKLREEEFRWLGMIKSEELKTRYYNIRIKVAEGFPAKRKARQDQMRLETGNAFSPEHRAALSEAHKGHTQSEESKLKRSESLRRAWADGKISGMRGKKWSDLHTEEQRAAKSAKISAALTGKTHTGESRAKISAAQTGKKRAPHSPETKAKMAEARRLYWERKNLPA